MENSAKGLDSELYEMIISYAIMQSFWYKNNWNYRENKYNTNAQKIIII